MNDPYRPIDCSLHDRIEHHATLHERVTVVYEDDAGATQEIETVISDWFAQDGAEYLRTAYGETIRLDRLLSVDGVFYR